MKHKLELDDGELSMVRDALFAQINANRAVGLSDDGPESDPLFKIMWRKTDIELLANIRKELWSR